MLLLDLVVERPVQGDCPRRRVHVKQRVNSLIARHDLEAQLSAARAAGFNAAAFRVRFQAQL